METENLVDAARDEAVDVAGEVPRVLKEGKESVSFLSNLLSDRATDLGIRVGCKADTISRASP